MKNIILINLILLIGLFIGCAVKNELPEKKSDEEDSIVSENNETQTILVNENFELPVKTITADSGEFEFQSPCNGSSKTKTTKGLDPTSIKESFTCNAGDINYTVSSNHDLTEINKYLEEVRKKDGLKRETINGFQTLEFKNYVFVTKTIGVPPNAVQKSEYQVMQNKIFLVNKSWIIDMSVECNSQNENFCKGFTPEDGQSSDFFKSLKILKK